MSHLRHVGEPPRGADASFRRGYGRVSRVPICLRLCLADLVSSGNAELAAVPRGCRCERRARRRQSAVVRRALKRVDNDSKLATTSRRSMARATLRPHEEAEKAADAIRKQASTAAFRELVAAQLSASNSAIAYQQSSASVADIIAKIQQGTEGYAATLDLTTEAGRRESVCPQRSCGFGATVAGGQPQGGRGNRFRKGVDGGCTSGLHHCRCRYGCQ